MVTKAWTISIVLFFALTQLHATRDTLVNLNSALGGISGVKLSSAGLPEGIQLSENGIISADTALEKALYTFELIALSPDESHYVVQVKYDTKVFPNKIYIHSDKIDMANGLRANGMIWVVVAVSLMVFSGLIIYLILLDRKINKLEKIHT